MQGTSRFGDQDQVRLYLTLGISAAKEGDVEQAQSYLERVLRLHPDLELRVQALMWLSRIAPDTAQKHAYLEQLLAFDPGNPEARREWAILEGRLAEDFRAPRENAGTESMADKGEGKAEKRPSRRFSCPNCGGSMRFDPWRKKLVCYYCGKMMTETEALEAGRLVSEGDFIVSMATGEGQRLQQLAYSVVCSACGASFVLPKGHFSGSCPFCASHLVVQVDLDEDIIPPHGILPFRVDEAGAKAAVQEWLGKSRWMIPTRFSRAVSRAAVHPRYVPYWAFDFCGTVKWNAVLAGNGNPDYLADALSILEEDILVPASGGLPGELLTDCADFDLDEVEPFSLDKTADWPAELYQVSMADASIQARQKMAEIARDDVQRLYLIGKSVNALNVATHMVQVDRYKLLLLPVWVFSFSYRGETRHILVNGQTGTVSGERPRSSPQVVVFVLLFLAVILAFALLIYLILALH